MIVRYGEKPPGKYSRAVVTDETREDLKKLCGLVKETLEGEIDVRIGPLKNVEYAKGNGLPRFVFTREAIIASGENVVQYLSDSAKKNFVGHEFEKKGYNVLNIDFCEELGSFYMTFCKDK